MNRFFRIDLYYVHLNRIFVFATINEICMYLLNYHICINLTIDRILLLLNGQRGIILYYNQLTITYRG